MARAAKWTGLAAVLASTVLGACGEEEPANSGGAGGMDGSSDGAGGSIGGSAGGLDAGADAGDGSSGAAGGDADAGGSTGLFDCDPPTAGAPFPKLQLTQVAKLARPLIAESPPGDANRLIIGEQKGVLHVHTNGVLLPMPFLDITNRVFQVGSEQGLLGLAFHPAFAQNGRFYVHYTGNGVTAPEGDTVVSELTVTTDPDVADPNSEKVLLTVDQPQANHNGGAIRFRGQAPFLFIGLGDGGNSGDAGPGHAPEGNGQSLETLLGKILRIDVDGSVSGKPYGVPLGNMAGANVEPEIWSYGLRNPYRFGFDPCTGDMYLADVGQNQIEEVNVEPANAPSGSNYGWRVMEGSTCFNATSCDTSGKVLPVAEYDHDSGCSIIGGHVYRGSKIPALRGYYLYADYCSGRFWTFRWNGLTALDLQEITDELNPGLKNVQITSFGQDALGELYVMSLTYGFVFRIDPE